MQTIKYIYWQEDDAWLGYLADYPDYWTQGESLDDLLDHLRELYTDIVNGLEPSHRNI
jgi:predicted RNase H-like HicB family nuclease